MDTNHLSHLNEATKDIFKALIDKRGLNILIFELSKWHNIFSELQLTLNCQILLKLYLKLFESWKRNPDPRLDVNVLKWSDVM